MRLVLVERKGKTAAGGVETIEFTVPDGELWEVVAFSVKAEVNALADPIKFTIELIGAEGAWFLDRTEVKIGAASGWPGLPVAANYALRITYDTPPANTPIRALITGWRWPAGQGGIPRTAPRWGRGDAPAGAESWRIRPFETGPRVG